MSCQLIPLLASIKHTLRLIFTALHHGRADAHHDTGAIRKGDVAIFNKTDMQEGRYLLNED